MKFLKYLIVCFSFLSCRSILYQVHSTESSNVRIDSVSGDYLYNDSLISIKYNMWSRGGKLTYTILNKTDSVISLDWNSSSFIKNGISRSYTKYNLSAYSTNRGFVIIPPHSNVLSHSIGLNQKSIIDKSSRNKKVKLDKKNYNDTNSFLSFRNYLTIYIDNDFSHPHIIDNKFWVSSTKLTKNKNDLIESPNSYYTKSYVKNRAGNFLLLISSSLFIVALLTL